MELLSVAMNTIIRFAKACDMQNGFQETPELNTVLRIECIFDQLKVSVSALGRLC